MLLRCWNCSYSIWKVRDFPLCELCLRLLGPRPNLCRECGGTASLAHENACPRPWLKRKQVLGYSSQYTIGTDNYDLLKKWKTSGTPLWVDQKIIHSEVLSFFRKCNAAIIPIPHATKRQWELRGSPSIRIASVLSRCLKLPIDFALQKKGAGKRQAEKLRDERMESLPRFETRSNIHDFKVGILVDDFRTTGSTLFAAADALSRAGWDSLWIHTLAVKPQSWALSSPGESKDKPHTHPQDS